MKVIDLLNKIANGELETFYKFKYRNKIVNMGYLIDNYLFLEILNDEVEIIEEKKIPEKLDDDELYLTESQQHIIVNKLNEIIDYLQSKGE